MSQYRRDPYPWTWEPAVSVLLGFCLLVVLGVQMGRGIACLAVGSGFCWADGGALFSSVWPILTGDSSAGLSVPVEMPGRVLALSIIGVVVAVLALVAVGAAWVLRRWGPGAVEGVASAGDVEQLLGRRRLYRVRRIVRPDIHGAPLEIVDLGVPDVTV